VVEESVKLKEGKMRLPSGDRIKKLFENTHLSYDDISPLANYYQVANNCMVYPNFNKFHFHPELLTLILKAGNEQDIGGDMGEEKDDEANDQASTLITK
jgi:hypothetical protein